MDSEKRFRIAPFITFYSFSHFVVDAACAFLLLGVLDFDEHLILGLLLYNATAFVLQAPFGFLIDKFLNPKAAAILGLLLIATSFLFWNSVFAALIIVGIGNALFHVAGGSLVLSLNKNKAAFSGIYVAPGGIGLALGAFLPFAPLHINLLFFPLILLILGITLCFIKIPLFSHATKKESCSDYRLLIIVLLMIPIGVRSFIGLSVEFPWGENQILYAILIAAIAFGKIVGGILADKYGLIKIGVGALLISAPIFAFLPTMPVFGILGAFVFNFTMPVTLIAMLNAIPRNKGLSFGLTTVALFLGALPVIFGKKYWSEDHWIVFFLILSASIILFGALQLMNKIK